MFDDLEHSYWLEHLCSRAVDLQLDDRPSQLSPISVVAGQSPHWNASTPRFPFWGDLTCIHSDGAPQVFNYATRFFSRCFVGAMGLVVALLLLGPILYRFYDLRKIGRTVEDQPTFRGQLAALFALAAPLLAMFRLHAPIELMVLSWGCIVALLHLVQDGKVAVCCPELLLYWAGMIPIYSSWALDRSLNDSVAPSCLLWASALLAVTVFYLELVNPERSPSNCFDDTTIFEKLSTSFITPAMEEAVNEPLNYDSLPGAPRGINSEDCYQKFRAILKKRPYSQRFRVIWSLYELLASEITLIVIFDLLEEMAGLLQPKLLQLMLSSMHDFADGKQPLFRCYYYALLFACFPLISYCLRALAILARSRGLIISRVSLMSVIYRKGLSLAPSARGEYDSAKLMSLINVDTNQLFDLAFITPNFITTPIALVTSLWQLWDYLGPSVATAGLVYIAFVPLTSMMSTRLGKINPLIRKLGDQRTKATSNIFRNIKSLKLYAWESPFFQRISHIRVEETSLTRNFQLIATALTVVWSSISDYVAVAVFAAFLYFHVGTLTAEIMFPALLLLDKASDYIMVWPTMIPKIYRTLNAQGRINDLLIQEEQNHANYSRSTAEDDIPSGFDDPTVIVSSADISWDGQNVSEKIALENISFQASRGDLVCITGRVGAGKTALLKALGGELSVLNGQIRIKGSLSYCSQEPWLQNMTLRDNVLFGQELCQEWYDKVIEACELVVDIDQMPKGDLTEIGERGISLSGGQKARVAIARAVYSRSDIILLDDVLSAVDEHVGAALIRKLLSVQGLLANRTIILATNNVKVLSQSSLILALENKQVVEHSQFSEVVRKGHSNSQTYRLIEEFGHASDLDVDPDLLIHRRELVTTRNSTPLDDDSKELKWLPTLKEVPLNVKVINIRSKGDDEEESEPRKETSALWVFRRYFDYLPSYYFWTLLGSLVLTSLSNSASTMFLGYMSNQSLETLTAGKWYFLVFLGVVTLKSSMNALAKMWGDVIIGVRLSRVIHDKMMWNVMHAPMSFFDSTPMGRLINRFSGDLGSVDYSIPSTARYFLQMIMSLLITVSTILIGSPLVTIFMIPLVWFGNNTRRLYVPTRRKSSRMVSAANSPILSHIEDSIKGQSVLRTFDRTKYFIQVHDLRVNYWIRISFFNRNLGRWLGFHMQVISTALSLVTALSLTFLTGLGLISVGYAAVVNNFAVRTGRLVGSIIAYIAQAEMNSVALERVLEYVDIDQEASPHIEATTPPTKWPHDGAMQVENLVARYKPDSPDVLKNLLFSIKAGEKIGVVGRTGSGKSSLTLSIFRILEARSGSIKIDDRDISILGLHDLRSRLSIIPQDAQVFNGSIRANLDPLEQVDDARLWEVLDLCHLKSRFEQQGKTLDTELSDAGENLSRGESQLLCLGRALIRESKILVLDEATASVDMETDQVVQETIRKYFADRTIITIAHRLNTIMDSDRVLVLEHGELKEFDTPQNLLNTRGLFYSLHNAESKEKTEDESLI